MKRASFIAALILVACSGREEQPNADAALQDVKEPVGVLRATSQGQTYWFKVREGADGTRLEVTCIECGDGAPAYREDTVDQLLGLFEPNDANDLVYSLWVAGSAYRVRVYAYGDGGVTRVLEAASFSYPRIDSWTGAVSVETGERSSPKTKRFLLSQGRFEATPGS